MVTEHVAILFHHLVQQVKLKGHMSIWVYGREKNLTLMLVNPFRKFLFPKLPLAMTYSIALALMVVIYPVASVYSFLCRLQLPSVITRFLPQYHFFSYLLRFPFRVGHSIIFDQLLAPVAFYHTRKDVETWFANARIQNPVITWRNCNSWRGFGKVKWPNRV